MSDSLSEEELVELIRHGRISTSRSAARQKTNRKSSNQAPAPIQKQERIVSPVVEVPGKEPDPEWLKAEKEKAQRNIAASRRDRQRRDEMQEASRF
jgi:hypothetical protein